jgi:very-short-patch-repair endonuclease
MVTVRLSPTRSPLTPLDKGGKLTPKNNRKVNGVIDTFYLPYNKKLEERSRELRKNMTLAEKRIWYEVLKNKSFKGLRFLKQHPINNFIVDFYCAKLKLVLEIDGDSHAEQEEYDVERTSVLEGYGLKVIRFNNSDILHNLHGVYETLLQEIIKRKKEILNIQD